MRRRPNLVACGLALLTGAALVLAACGGDDDAASADGRVDVVAAFYPLAEAVRQVGGDAVHVTDLTPAGAEPHDLELTPGQVDELEGAHLVVAMGHDFQPALEDIAGRRDADETVFVLDDLSIDAGDKSVEEGGANALDPHVWLDPELMQEIVATVAGALGRIDPERAQSYAANAQQYSEELAALDQEYAQGLAHCERDEIVTAHEAFGWLAKRYGLEQHAIAGIAPDQEPSADRIAELSDLAEKDGVTTIFTETLVSPRVAETLAREAGGLKSETLNPLEGLTDDEIERGADYVSVMRDNLASLREALGCS
jgi:zinc transport system substrate-binding protein